MLQIQKRSQIHKAFCNHFVLFSIHSFFRSLIRFRRRRRRRQSRVHFSLHIFILLYSVNTKTLCPYECECECSRSIYTIPRRTRPALSPNYNTFIYYITFFSFCFLHPIRLPFSHNFPIFASQAKVIYLWGDAKCANDTHAHTHVHWVDGAWVFQRFAFCWARNKSTNASFLHVDADANCRYFCM